MIDNVMSMTFLRFHRFLNYSGIFEIFLNDSLIIPSDTKIKRFAVKKRNRCAYEAAPFQHINIIFASF